MSRSAIAGSFAARPSGATIKVKPDWVCVNGHQEHHPEGNNYVQYIESLTGEGLAEVLKGASVVVDVSNSPSWDDAAVLKFFLTSTRNLLTYEAAAGVGHHVALSVVGTRLLAESGYFRTKIAQEKLIKVSRVGSPTQADDNKRFVMVHFLNFIFVNNSR